MTDKKTTCESQKAHIFGVGDKCVFCNIKKKPEPCNHDWAYVDGNPSHCKKCGMSLMAHAFMECP